MQYCSTELIKMKTRYIGLSVVIVILLVVLSGFVLADSVDVLAGHSFYLDLQTDFGSLNWAGLRVVNSGGSLSESTSPFVSIPITTPLISLVNFPGANLKDEEHYYAAMLRDSFDLDNVQNVSALDLEENQLFNSVEFPQFYGESYYSYSDNPQNTFCCDTATIPLAGQNFTAFAVNLTQNIPFYVLKYDDGSGPTPLFLVPFQDALGYNNTACVAEFMLPLSPTDYQFYAFPEYQAYEYDVYIDGLLSTSFPQTALPYNLTVVVKDIYSGNVVPNVSVLVGEDSGQNIFVPYKFSGFVSSAYSVGRTNDEGQETFIVAPTVYPSDSSYSIYLAVLQHGKRTSRASLDVVAKDALVTVEKRLSPSRLLDNTKASVNAMNQIVSYMYLWSSQLLQAKKFAVNYDVLGDSFTTYNYQINSIVPAPIKLKTGAPNVITVQVVNTGGAPTSLYSFKVVESDGYLIMSPYTDSAPLTQTDRTHEQAVLSGTDLIIAPTSLGFVNASVVLEVYEGSRLIGNLSLDVDPTLNIVSGGQFYNNDILKTVVNAMNQIVNSLFNALN